MKFNKQNLKNIYKYNPELLEKFNSRLETYQKHTYIASNFFELITNIDKDFDTLKSYFKPFINHLVDKTYTIQSLEQISTYSNALFKVDKNNYHPLLEIVKSNLSLNNYFEEYKKENAIFERYDLYNIMDENLKTYGMDGIFTTLIEPFNRTDAEFLEINPSFDDLITYKTEASVFKKVYKNAFNSFNNHFFSNLKVIDTKDKNLTLETDIEMEF